MAWWPEPLRAFLAVLLMALAPLGANAQQAVIDSYQQNDGLTNLAVVSLAQTPSGMLWIGTQGGLFHFNGFRIQRIHLPLAAGVDVRAVLAHPQNGIWVATMEGLFFGANRDGELRWDSVVGPGGAALLIEHDQRLDLTAQGDLYAMDRHGTLWTSSATQPRRASRVPLPPYPAFAGAKDGSSVYSVGPLRLAADALWFGCGSGLCEWHGGHLRLWGLEQGLPERVWGNLVVGRDGSVWARASDHLARLRPGAGRFEAVAAPTAESWTGSVALVEDGQGAIVTAFRSGLARWDGVRWQEWTNRDGIPATDVRVLKFSSDGGLWFGTLGRGLHHWVGYGAVDQWTPVSGLPSPIVFSLARDGVGCLWVSTTRGLAWFDERLRRFHPLQGLPNSQGAVISLATDANGDLWWVQNGQLLRMPAGSKTAQLMRRDPSLVQTLQGRNHAVYLSGRSALELVVRTGSGWEFRPLLHDLSDPVVEIDTDGQHEWFLNGHVNRLEQNTLVPLRDQHGKPLNIIFTGSSPSPGHLWVDDSHGLARYEIVGNQALLRQRFDAAIFNHSLCNFLTSAPDGRLWCGTSLGVYMHDHGRWQLLNHSNGLLWDDTDERSFWLDTDGTAWIGTSAGITQVHPGWQDAPPADLRLNELQFGSHVTGEVGQLTIPWVDRNLRVVVGTPAISRGRALRVEYRLHDASPWLPAEGDALQIEALSQGSHTLQLRAVAKGGLGQAGPPLHIGFTVAPPWWLSGPAWVAYALCLLALLAGSHMLASRRALKVRLKLEQAVADRTFELAASREALRKLGEYNARALEVERTHVARELHDEMGQQLAALRLEASVLQASARAGHTLVAEQFNLLFERFNLLVRSVRALVKQLRPPALDGGIVAAIEWLADEFSTTTGIACQLDLDAAAQDLPQDSAIMVFRIAQESLTNVRRHAQASQVKIRLKRGPDGSCILLVSDDGIGMKTVHGREGHGLLGMEERARLLGGELTICSQPGAGTSVLFHVDEQTRRRHAPGAPAELRGSGRRGGPSSVP